MIRLLATRISTLIATLAVVSALVFGVMNALHSIERSVAQGIGCGRKRRGDDGRRRV